MIRNMIWDVGGTLFDTYPAMTGAFLSALSERGIQAPEDWVRSLAQVSQKHCAQTLAENYHLDQEALWQRYRHFLDIASPEESPPFPGAREVCRWIAARGGLNLIATHRAPDLTARLLQHHGLASLFAEVVSVFDGYPRKPDPAMLSALIERKQLRPAETLAVGDREIDIQAARAAGLTTCLFRGDDRLAADLHIHSYYQLLDLLAMMSSLNVA